MSAETIAFETHTSPDQLVIPINIEPVEGVQREQNNDGFEYELLKGHNRTDGVWKTDAQLRTEYVRLSDNLVDKITNGVETKDAATGEKSIKPIDFVVWLDKSSRPVSWLVSDLWPILAKKEDGSIPEKPKSKFVNIDREQWTSEVDPNGVGSTLVQDISPTIIRSLRSIFLEHPKDRRDNLGPHIDDAPTQFDDKTILIVDEVRSSGRTLRYSHEFFKRAFPKTNIAETYWMSEVTTIDGAIGNADIPVWYSDDTILGRGVGNRNIDKSLKSSNRTQRLGARFLSVALKDPDPLSILLRKEFKHLADDVRAKKVLVEPSREREEADYNERALRINGLDNFNDYLGELNKLKNDK